MCSQDLEEVRMNQLITESHEMAEAQKREEGTGGLCLFFCCDRLVVSCAVLIHLSVKTVCMYCSRLLIAWTVAESESALLHFHTRCKLMRCTPS